MFWCLSSLSDKLSVGFVYTFQVTEDRQREVFFLTTPKDDTSLSFKFDIKYNPDDQDVLVQLFLGRSGFNLFCLSFSPDSPCVSFDFFHSHTHKHTLFLYPHRIRGVLGAG